MMSSFAADRHTWQACRREMRTATLAGLVTSLQAKGEHSNQHLLRGRGDSRR